MDKQRILEAVNELYRTIPGNILPDTEEVDPPCRGIRLFDEPIAGFGDALDPLFARYKDPGIIGPWHRTPREWMPEAETVISFFFPISEEIRKANAAMKDHACLQWVYARIEGQAFIDAFLEALRRWFAGEGTAAFVPSASEEFGTVRGGRFNNLPVFDCVDENTFASNWSERHAAYVCGLGTFSLTRGVITRKGMAGRFASILIGQKLKPDERPYTGVYDYCIRCGKCIARCPEDAISLENGKDQKKCAVYSDKSKKMFYPRYGCGLCQTGVPCETGIPSAGGKRL